MSGTRAWVADRLLDRRRQRAEVRLRVHRAWLDDVDGYPLSEPLDCYFLNIWNASPRRRVKVTHVWVELPGGS
jgi:hypothetical protein